MSDPREPLPSLQNPTWLKDLIAAFPDKPAVIQWGTNVFLEQVNRERMARLAELSTATAPERTKVIAEAMKEVGSMRWLKMMERTFVGLRGEETYGRGSSKCNLFVFEMMARAGVPVPMELREQRVTGIQQSFPPLANQWANPRFAIAGFEVLTVPPDVPQPGDVAARKSDEVDASGHVGIVAGNGQTVSATPNQGVVHNDWGFRAEQKGEVVFRRYVGSGESTPPEDLDTRSTTVTHDTVPPIPDKPREPNKCTSPARRNGK